MSDSIRPAATVIVVRDGNDGLEVLLLSRNPNIGGAHYGDAWVFPGGALEAEDSHSDWSSRIDLTDDHGPRFEDKLGSFDAYRIAAIRECYEEAGIVLGASKQNLQAIESKGDGESFLDCCEDLVLRLSDVVYTSHWVTPLGRPKRFDTRFFTAVLPQGQVIRHDGVEAIAHQWFKPQAALAAFYGGEVTLWPPTQYSLLMLCEFDGTRDLLSFLTARDPAAIPSTCPRLDEKKRPIFPWSKNY